MPSARGISYQDAGVNIDEADRAVDRIKVLARQTFTSSVLTNIGSFGAAFQLKGFRNPVLMSSADGVGTKLKVAFLAGVHNTVGEDLVNHCVNDIMVQGAEPLFFLDYIATGRVAATLIGEIIEGMARGCSANHCALIGGETAEMPGFYHEGEYDLAGFIVGAVEKPRLLTGDAIRKDDIVLGLPSNGLHTNGYSLARRLLFDEAGYKHNTRVATLGCTVAEELLKVHRSYATAIRALRKSGVLKGAAHITGGGITENTPRILPKGLAVEIDTRAWQAPAVFQLMRSIGNVPVDDWRRTFNLGIGMILVIGSRDLARTQRILKKAGEPYYVIGQVVTQAGSQRVVYVE